MTSARIVVLGLALIALVLALVIGFAWQALGDRFKSKQPTRTRAGFQRPRKPPALIARLTPERTKLRPYSPEILAVVLVALAAGLWLSRLLS